MAIVLSVQFEHGVGQFVNMLSDIVLFHLWWLVGALLVAAGVYVAHRELRLAGTAICIGAICLVGASSLYVHPHPTVYKLGLPSDVKELQDQIVQLTLDRDRQRNARMNLWRQLDAKELELQAAAQRSRSLEELHNTAQAELENTKRDHAETAALRVASEAALKKESEGHSRLKQDHAQLSKEYEAGRASLRQTIAALNDTRSALSAAKHKHTILQARCRQTIISLNSKLAERTTHDASPQIALRSPPLAPWLAKGVTTPHYRIALQPSVELISGKGRRVLHS